MIHMEPFLLGERPFHFDPATVKTWRRVKVYWTAGEGINGKYDQMCLWCSKNCMGEWSTWNEFFFEKEKDATHFMLVWK